MASLLIDLGRTPVPEPQPPPLPSTPDATLDAYLMLATREARRSIPHPTPFSVPTPRRVATRAYSPPKLIVVPTSAPPTPRPYPTLPPLLPVTPPPFPTVAVPTLPPLPTFEPPSPPRGQKVPIPEFVPVTATEVEFAAACGELMGADLGTETFAEWVTALQGLEAPPAFQDFWDARVSLYAFQLSPDGDAVGVNSLTQRAYDREIEIVAGMRPSLRQALIDGWCLSETSVLLGTHILAAKARLAAGQPTLSYEDYAQACADIDTTAPTFDTADAFMQYVIEWWQALVPPPGVEKYHAAVLDLYLEVRAVGGLDFVGTNYLLAIEEEAGKVEGDFVEHLLRSGCI